MSTAEAPMAIADEVLMMLCRLLQVLFGVYSVFRFRRYVLRAGPMVSQIRTTQGWPGRDYTSTITGSSRLKVIVRRWWLTTLWCFLHLTLCTAVTW